MATYKGIGWDTTNITTKVNQAGDSLDIDGALSVAEGVTIVDQGLQVDAGGINVDGGGATITGNSTITGNLTVTGNLISNEELQVLVKDNFIDLNVGYVGTAYEQTGLTFNYQGVSGKVFTVDSATNGLTFTAGTTTARARLVVGGTSVISGGTFAAGDILQISGTTDGENDGIFIVHDQTTADTIDIKSSTLTVPDTVNSAFALLDFTADTQSTGNVTIAIVNLMALRASSTGQLESATGDADSDFATYSDVGASTTLQEAYDAGNTITTSGSTDVTITTTSGNFVVQGGGQADFGSSTPLSAFNLDTTGEIAIDSSAGTISLDAGAASNFTTSAGVLTLSGAGGITNTSTGGGYTINATGQTVDINSAAFDVDGTTMTINGSGAGHFIVADELDLQSTTGNVDIDASGNVDIDAGSAVSIQGGATSDFTVTGNDVADVSLSLISGNTGAGEGNIGLTSSTAGTITIQNGAGNSELIITTDTATFGVDVVPDTNDTFDLGSSSNAWKDLYLSESVEFKGATGENEIVLPSNLADALSVTDGVGDVFKIVSSTGSEQFEFSYGVQFDNNTGFLFATESTFADSLKDEDDMASDDENALATQQSIKAYVDNGGQNADYSSLASITADGTGLAIRDVVAINASGLATKASNASGGEANVVGISLTAVAGSATAYVAQHGKLGGFSGLTAGTKYYLGTGGAITSTAPSATGETVYQIGYAVSTTEIVIELRHVMVYG